MNTANENKELLDISYKFGISFLGSDSRKQPFRTFLFGYPIAHSFAPLLHNTLFKENSLPWSYELLESRDGSDLIPALKKQDIVGCAITMPYKVSMLSVVDDLTEEGTMIGAINTIFLRRSQNGSIRYIGTNTDCVGIREAFLRNFKNILAKSTGKPALIIGGGGACRAAIYALWKWLGVSQIYIVNRLEHEVVAIQHSFKKAGFDGDLIHVATTEQAAVLDTPVLVVGTIPDYQPREPGELMVRSIVNHFLARQEKGFILEMCYHPKPKTTFFELGEQAGWAMLYGTESMIWQGVAQQSLWAELPLGNFDLKEANRVVSEAIRHHS